MSALPVRAPNPVPYELTEITGPTAFGGGTRRFFDLLWLTSVAELKLRYVGSVLGYGWTLLRPLLFAGILYVVFTQIFDFGNGVEDYGATLILNLMLFEFFAEATGFGVGCVVAQENMVRKMQFPRIVIPLSVTLTSAFTLLLDLVAAIVFLLILGVEPMWSWLLLPVLVLGLVWFTAGMVLILSVLFVRYRDVQHLWAVAVRAVLYGLPVLYTVQFVADVEVLRWLVAANPLSPIFEMARVWMIDPGDLTVIDVAAGNPLLVILPLGLLVAVPIFGLWYFNRRAPRIAEAL